MGGGAREYDPQSVSGISTGCSWIGPNYPMLDAGICFTKGEPSICKARTVFHQPVGPSEILLTALL